MLDHLSLRVSNYARSRRFFEATLAPLGYAVLMEFESSAGGFGAGERPDFWIAQGQASSPVHVAFVGANRATVDAFYKAAIVAGGRDNGAPGLRPQYEPSYYGAFVLDPDGNNIEAVCRKPE
jgi:catechol 2,3-dioxygenase-like lactoylglutathione lyase family enzyme